MVEAVAALVAVFLIVVVAASGSGLVRDAARSRAMNRVVAQHLLARQQVKRELRTAKCAVAQRAQRLQRDLDRSLWGCSPASSEPPVASSL